MNAVSRLSPVEELVDFLAQRPSREEIPAFRLSVAALRHVSELMDKHEAGTLTSEESHELDRLVLLDDVVGLIRLRAASGPRAPQFFLLSEGSARRVEEHVWHRDWRVQ